MVIVGGIEIGKALREMCLRFSMDTWEATGRSRAADPSRCLLEKAGETGALIDLDTPH